MDGPLVRLMIVTLRRCGWQTLRRCWMLRRAAASAARGRCATCRPPSRTSPAPCGGRGACSQRCARLSSACCLHIVFAWRLQSPHCAVSPLAGAHAIDRCQGALPDRGMPAVLQSARLIMLVVSDAGLTSVLLLGPADCILSHPHMRSAGTRRAGCWKNGHSGGDR